MRTASNPSTSFRTLRQAFALERGGSASAGAGAATGWTGCPRRRRRRTRRGGRGRRRPRRARLVVLRLLVRGGLDALVARRRARGTRGRVAPRSAAVRARRGPTRGNAASGGRARVRRRRAPSACGARGEHDHHLESTGDGSERVPEGAIRETRGTRRTLAGEADAKAACVRGRVSRARRGERRARVACAPSRGHPRVTRLGFRVRDSPTSTNQNERRGALEARGRRGESRPSRREKRKSEHEQTVRSESPKKCHIFKKKSRDDLLRGARVVLRGVGRDTTTDP